MKKTLKRQLAALLIAAMCLGQGNCRTWAEELETETETFTEAMIEDEAQDGGVGQTDTEGQIEESSVDAEQTTENVENSEQTYQGENYRVTFRVDSSWDGGYTGEIILENTGDTKIENWSLAFDYQGTFSNVWNAEISETENSDHADYLAKNAGWNQDIAVGESISFGFCGQESFAGFPTMYQLISNQTQASTETYEIQYETVSYWETGYVANITITNKSSEPLEDWTLEFDMASPITDLWNGMIESAENGHYVIKNADYNANIQAGGTVTIGFQGTCQGDLAEPENYSLQTYSNELTNEDTEESIDLELLQDMTKVQNAYMSLAIGYAQNNDANSVTNDVELPTELEGATITWISGDPETISPEGKVTRTGQTKTVSLKAVISSNEYSLSQDYSLRVVKNTYEDYDLETIYDMESLEYLYLYNDDEEDLEVYLNEDGYIDELNGCFSQFIVESPEEAILALYEVKSLMGCQNPKEELAWDKTCWDNYGYSYKFYQVVDGIPVYGNSIVVSTDLEGNIIALHSSYVSGIQLDTENVISENQAEAVAADNGYTDVEAQGLNVYTLEGVHLVYNLEGQKDGENYTVLVDAKDGEITFVNALETAAYASVESGVDLQGNTQNFVVERETDSQGNSTYLIDDYCRNIQYYDLEGGAEPGHDNGKHIEQDNNDWTPDEISISVNMANTYDFYLNTFGRHGYDNKNGHMYVSINWAKANAQSIYGYDLSFGLPSKNYSLENPSVCPYQAGADIVGHEYTHSVIDADTEMGSNYTNETGAINEAYADIMGNFVEGDDDLQWNHGEHTYQYPERILGAPDTIHESKKMPKSVGGAYYYDYTKDIEPNDDNDHGGVHTNSSIISYACYLMWRDGISDKARLANLWYTSIKYGYDANTSFQDVRVNLLRAARAMKMSGEEIAIIKNAFDTVNVKGTVAQSIEGSNVIFGKVVIADADTVTGNNVALANAIVTLSRYGSTGSVSQNEVAISAIDGTFQFYNVKPGSYLITVEKEGYITAKRYCSVISQIQ